MLSIETGPAPPAVTQQRRLEDHLDLPAYKKPGVQDLELDTSPASFPALPAPDEVRSSALIFQTGEEGSKFKDLF